MSKLRFIQGTTLSSNKHEQIGLFDVFDHYLQEQLSSSSVVTQQKVIVPNKTMSSRLKHQLTGAHGVCAGIDFVVLLGPIIEQIYLLNHPKCNLFKFEQSRFIIYKYLLNFDITHPDFSELTQLLSKQGSIDQVLAFELAGDLHKIFQEYIYFRTAELINARFLETLPKWQMLIWEHLFNGIGGDKTYLDIYKYFMNTKKIEINVPSLFIFGLGAIANSQLHILLKLSQFIPIYWFYVTPTPLYYGDLLSTKARENLDRKILKYPDLEVDDLYLVEGNLLLGNLAIQSRELRELLLAHDIEIHSLDEKSPSNEASSLLEIIQSDIVGLKQRVAAQYRIKAQNNYYANPINLDQSQINLKIQVCYNKMREVQVMLETLCGLFANNPQLKLTDVIVVAPDIAEYISLLDAVLANEYIEVNQEKHHIPYHILGQRSNVLELELQKRLLQIPYSLSVEYLWELITSFAITNYLELSIEDISWIKRWLEDNNTSLGYNAQDFVHYGYIDQGANSFYNFLINLVLGFSIPQRLFFDQGSLPVFTVGEDQFVPYDNLENSQLESCNKLIKLIELLVTLRDFFYIDENTYRSFILEEFAPIILAIKNCFKAGFGKLVILDQLVAKFMQQDVHATINLPILVKLFTEYQNLGSSGGNLSGKLICGSMNILRYIPAKVIYVLGMDFGKYPRSYSISRLSQLYNYWSIADRNYTLEDKQIFIDLLLQAQNYLFLSYVGRNQINNNQVAPSSIVSSITDVISSSLSNFEELKPEIICEQKLNAFEASELKFSGVWQNLAKNLALDFKDQRWDCNKIITPQAIDKTWPKLNLDTLIKTFLYSNINLNRRMKFNIYNQWDEKFYDFFEGSTKLSGNHKNILRTFNLLQQNRALDYFIQSGKFLEYCIAKGVVTNNNLDAEKLKQFASIYQLYFCDLEKEVMVEYTEPNLEISLNDRVWLNQRSQIVVMPDNLLVGTKFGYPLKIKALIYALLAKSAKFFDDKAQQIQVDSCEVRIVNENNKLEIYRVNLSQIDYMESFTQMLRFYYFSLSNPVLIHKGAINKYLEFEKDKNFLDKFKQLQTTYFATFNNYDLENIKNDPIGGAIWQNYFAGDDYTHNSLLQIAEFLELATFEQVARK